MTSQSILPTPLVSTDWLATHLGDPDLRVLDATTHLTGPESGNTGWSLRPGPDDYLAAHIPGAVFADVLDDLSEPDGGAVSKPSPARFAAAAGRLGIGPASRVVVYALDPHWATCREHGRGGRPRAPVHGRPPDDAPGRAAKRTGPHRHRKGCDRG